MWMTTVQEGGQTYTVAFRGGEIPNAGAPLVDNPRHPTVVEDTQRTLRVLKELDPPRSLCLGSVCTSSDRCPLERR